MNEKNTLEKRNERDDGEQNRQILKLEFRRFFEILTKIEFRSFSIRISDPKVPTVTCHYLRRPRRVDFGGSVTSESGRGTDVGV